MTEQELIALLDNINRFDNKVDEYFVGWRNALDIVEIDIREFFREKGGAAA